MQLSGSTYYHLATSFVDCLVAREGSSANELKGVRCRNATCGSRLERTAVNKWILLPGEGQWSS